MKNALYFGAGVIVGGIAAYFGVRGYCIDEYNKRVNSIREYYAKKIDELDTIRKDIVSLSNRHNEEKAHERNGEKRDINYNDVKIYRPTLGEVNHDYISNDVKTEGRSPVYILRGDEEDEFGNEPDYEADTLMYYKKSSILVDPITKSIVDPIERFGEEIFSELENTDAETIYIRDETVMLDTEIIITDDDYEDE